MNVCTWGIGTRTGEGSWSWRSLEGRSEVCSGAWQAEDPERIQVAAAEIICATKQHEREHFQPDLSGEGILSALAFAVQTSIRLLLCLCDKHCDKLLEAGAACQMDSNIGAQRGQRNCRVVTKTTVCKIIRKRRKAWGSRRASLLASRSLLAPQVDPFQLNWISAREALVVIWSLSPDSKKHQICWKCRFLSF